MLMLHYHSIQSLVYRLISRVVIGREIDYRSRLIYNLISSTDVSTAVSKLKTDKVNDNGMIYSNNFIHGTELLFQYLGLLYTSMVYHGYCPPSFICANIIPIPKGSKANLSDSDKYRSIAISSLL